jgi:hypothetical protein
VDEFNEEAESVQRIREMPKEVGVLLVVAGIGGLLLPGPVGSPFVILGGVILWPRVFERVEIAFARRFPGAHRQSVRQIGRFLTDLDRRYPLHR